MESGVVKLTPQWLSFTNNQPQQQQDDQKQRNGSQAEGHRERYGDRGRYNNFSGRSLQPKHGNTERTSDVRSSSGSITTSISASPPRLGRSKSLNTLKKEPNAETPPPPPQAPSQTPAAASPSLPEIRAPSPTNAAPVSPAPNGPPKSSYDKHFPALAAQKKSKSTPSGLIAQNEDPVDNNASISTSTSPLRTTSPPLPTVSLATIIPVLAVTNTLPARSVPKLNSITSPPSTTPVITASLPTIVNTPPPLPVAPAPVKQKPALSSWTGTPARTPSTVQSEGPSKAILPPTTSVPPVVLAAPVPVQPNPSPILTPVATAASPFRPTPKVSASPIPLAVSVAKAVTPSLSPSPPPTANAGKSPAVIIREAPKAAPAKNSISTTPLTGSTPPALSHEIERAKSLIPSQPIVPKPLAKNRNDHHSANAKSQSKQQNSQNKLRVSPQRTKRLVKKATNTELDATSTFGSLLSSDNMTSQADHDNLEPVKIVQKDPVKLLPRNNFFKDLRKQEEQKRKGITEKEDTVASNEHGQSNGVKVENGHTANGDVPEQPTQETTPIQPTPQETTILPEQLPPPEPHETETQPEAISNHKSESSHLQLSEEEEQRLLKQFGWSPDDNAGSDDDDYSIPDEEIQALKNQLNQHKESLTQKRETRLNSLAQSVEQWQQRLLSASTTPIKSP